MEGSLKMVNPEVGVAVIAYEALYNGEDQERAIELSDMAAIARQLEEETAVPLGDFGVYESGKGYCSDVVDQTVGNYLRFGYASQRNPLRLTQTGKKVLELIVSEAEVQAPDAVRTIREKVVSILKKMHSRS